MIAIPLGVLAAIYKDSIFDRMSAGLAYAALSIPEFFLALILVFFAAQTGLFPLGGATSIDYEYMSFGGKLLDRAHHLILPTLALGIGSIASIMRIMRANFIDTIRGGFVITARSKGVRESVVMFKHVLRNAINPLVTLLGFEFANLLGGAFIAEFFFGMGNDRAQISYAFFHQQRRVIAAKTGIGINHVMTGMRQRIDHR